MTVNGNCLGEVKWSLFVSKFLFKKFAQWTKYVVCILSVHLHPCL